MSSLAAIVLESDCDLLDHRFVIDWPASGWSDSPYTHFGGPMGFDRLSPHEHWAGFDTEIVRFKLLARESYRLYGGELKAHAERTAREVTAGWGEGCDVEEIESSSHFLLLPRTPPLGDTGEAHLVAFAYLAHPDGCVVEMRYFVDPAGLETDGLEAVHEFVRRMAKSARPGDREYRRGPCQLGLSGVAKNLERHDFVLELAPNFVSTIDRGPDFVVHRLFEVVPLGEASGPALMIYFGANPSYQGPAAEPPNVEVGPPVFGQDTKWRVFSERLGDRQLASLEVILSTALEKDHFCHLRMDGFGPEQLTTLGKMVASLRFVDPDASD